MSNFRGGEGVIFFFLSRACALTSSRLASDSRKCRESSEGWRSRTLPPRFDRDLLAVQLFIFATATLTLLLLLPPVGERSTERGARRRGIDSPRRQMQEGGGGEGKKLWRLHSGVAHARLKRTLR